MQDMLPFIYSDLQLKPYPVVLAQDAAGAEELTDLGGRSFPGAFCLAAARSHTDEINWVLERVETVGTRSYRPDGLGALPRWCDASGASYTLPRTVIPAHWCTTEFGWIRLLARRWHTAIPIGEGELRSAVTWAKVVALDPAAAGCEILDLGDNQVAVANLAHGRSGVGSHNRQLQQEACHEAAVGFRLRSLWLGTSHQPGDGGTRPTPDGRLEVGPVTWAKRDRILCLFSGAESVREALQNHGIACSSAWPGPYDPLHRGRWREVIRTLESRRVRLVVICLPKCSVSDEWRARARQVIQLCGAHGTAYLVYENIHNNAVIHHVIDHSSIDNRVNVNIINYVHHDQQQQHSMYVATNWLELSALLKQYRGRRPRLGWTEGKASGVARPGLPIAFVSDVVGVVAAHCGELNLMETGPTVPSRVMEGFAAWGWPCVPEGA